MNFAFRLWPSACEPAVLRDPGAESPSSQRTSCLVLLAAILADPINLKCVPGGQVMVFTADFLLELPDFLREKLHRTAALGANHVVMAAAIVLVLVTGDAVMERDLARQATLG